MSRAAGVAVAIPTFRDPERLRACVTGVREAATVDETPIDLIIVLDGADRDVERFAAHELERATVISWPERRGFAAALNAAGRSTDAALLVVIQDDARPRASWLRALLECALREPSAGAIGSLVLRPDGRVRRAGQAIGGDGGTADLWADEPPPAAALTRVRAVDYVSSASFLMRREAWASVGGFDEELYPVVYVDADFCTALWNRGWKVLLEPRSVVVHEGGGSTSEPFREFLYARNRERFVAKWGPCFAGRPSFPLGKADPDRVDAPGAWSQISSPSEGVAPGPLIEASPETYVRRERDVLRAYVTTLEARLAHRRPADAP